MRLHPEKEDCHVIDMVGTIDQGIVTVPTLFGLDPSEMVEKATVASMKAMADELAQEEAENPPFLAEPRPLNVTFIDYENVWDLLADHREGRHIRQLSSLAWVTVGMDRYVLSLRGGGHVKIELELDRWFPFPKFPSLKIG